MSDQSSHTPEDCPPRRLLLLAYYFPPSPAIASVRAWNMALNLRRLGWEVTVISPDPAVWRHGEQAREIEGELQREGITRLASPHQWRWLSPQHLKCHDGRIAWLLGGICRKVAAFIGYEPEGGWCRGVISAAAQLAPGDIDLILATGRPFSAFKLARDLAHRLHCRYIVDYRDLWTGNPHVKRPFSRATIALEQQILADCAAVTAIAPSMAKALQINFSLDAQKIFTIYNGYNTEETQSVVPRVFDHFSIVYTGRFYPPKRVITPILRALQHLEHDMAVTECYFHYYGPHDQHVQEEAARLGVLQRVVLHGNVTREEALAAIAGADVAVVITSVLNEASLADKGIITGKLLEPLGLGTPVLLIAPPGSDAEMLIAYSALSSRCAGTDTAGIAAYLAARLHHRGEVSAAPAELSWTSLAHTLHATLAGVLATPPPSAPDRHEE